MRAEGMRPLRVCTWLVLASLGVAPGCQMFYPSRPIVVLARDADTQKPIADAKVRISYPSSGGSFPISDSVGRTADDGLCHLTGTALPDSGIVVSVTTNGYLSEEKYLTAQTVQAIEPARFFEAVSRRPANVVLEVYAEPGPKVELVLPPGYRGQVKVDVQIQDDAPRQPGQRCFPCEVSSSGIAQITGPPLLRRLTPGDFTAKYANGIQLARYGADPEVALWWLRTERGCEYFLVGTHSEFERQAPSKSRDDIGDLLKSYGGGKGGGSGGRRGRKGMQPTDPTSDGSSP